MKRFSLFFAAVFAAVNLFAADFTKVTAAPADWAGEYALVNEGTDANYVFNGVDANASAEVPGSVEVTITDGTITDYTGPTIVVAALAEGGYSVAVKGGANDGKFLASGSSAPTFANALKFITNAQRVDFAYSDGVVVMSQIADKDVTSVDSVVSLQFNASNSEKRFRFYKSVQQPVQLYRLAEGGSEGGETTTGLAYELNGGQFNPRNWMTEQDMFWGYIQDYNAFASLAFDSTAMAAGEFYNKTYGKTDPWTMFDDATYGADWAWLKTYIISRVALFQDIDEAAAATALSASVARGALDNFFNNGALNATAWNKSFDATACGISSHLFYNVWGYTFANPTEVAAGETVTLISPYKTGYIFRGWYDNAAFTGTPVTTITSATTGTLYAKWEENNATEITYVLNGGVTNEYGWATPADMYQGLAADVWAAKENGTCSAFAWASDFTGVFGEPNTAGTTGPAHDIQSFDLTFWTAAPYAEKWGWLGDYLDETAIAAGQANTAKTNGSYARYALAAFFGDTIRPGWPASADYTNAGVSALAAYQPYWKHSFNNPASVTEETALYAPYMEGYTFEGWYAAEDFSGPKVTTIDATTVGTLYAKFVEYIPSIKEILAMEDSVITKVKGTVNHIDGRTLYVTDATGGILVFCKATPTCQVGDVITATGKKVMYCGAPEISSAEITATEAGRVADPISITIGELKLNPIKYLAQRVAITGVKIVAYDTYNNPTVKEGTDEVLCYKIVLDPTAFPVGKKVNLTAVVGYHDALQFVGNAADFELVITAGRDAAVYEEKTSENGSKYAIANDWLFSNYLGNFAANKPNPLAEQCRSMVVKDGIMYFPWRYGNATDMNARLIRVDAMTGEMLDPIVLADSVMREYTPMVLDTVINGTDTVINKVPTKVWETTGDIIFASCSDLKMDEAGHAYLMNLQTGNIFTVWEIDLATGAAHNVIYMGGQSGIDGLAKMFPDAAGSDNNVRVDRMGIVGDLHVDGSIYGAQNANGNVFRFDFQNGVWDGQPVIVSCAKPGDENAAASFGDAPQIYPVEGGMFYVDGAATFPTLYDEEGNVLASFTDDEEKAILLAADPNVNASPNGVREFELNGEYFMVMAGSNYDAGDGVANSTTLVFKCLDANRNFNEMTPYWVLPQDGMSQINRQGVDPQRVCVSHVDVDEANHTATLYIFAAEQGYGKYTITATPAIQDALENIEAEGVNKVFENGQVYIIKNGVKYNVLGAVVK